MSETPVEPGSEYVDLAGLLAAYVDERELLGLVGLSDLSALALEVRLASIGALLLGRAPDVLDPANGDRFALLLESIAGVTAEVEAVTGPDPAPAARRALARRAIALGTAAELEAALFPEQQLGQDARAEILRSQYERVLGVLQGQDLATGVVSVGPAAPRGSFPSARPYPDPIERCRPSPYRSSW